MLAKRTRLQGVENPDFAVDKAALPPVPARQDAAATAAAPLPRPPPPEGERPGAAPIPQESVPLPGKISFATAAESGRRSGSIAQLQQDGLATPESEIVCGCEYSWHCN